MGEGNVRVLRLVARLNIGGPAIHTILLTRHMQRLGYETLLVAGQVGQGEGGMAYLAEAEGVEPIIIPQLGRKLRLSDDLAAFFHILRLLFTFQPHIVHTHTAKAGTLGRLAALLYNTIQSLRSTPLCFFQKISIVKIRNPKSAIQNPKSKVLHTFHGHVLRGYFSPFKSRLFQGIEKILAKFTDAIVVVSESQKRELCSNYHIALASKFRVIPLGFDLEPFLSCKGDSGQWSVVSGQWAGDRRRKSEVRGQWTVVRRQPSVVSDQKSGVSGQWTVVSGQKAEDRKQKTEGRRQETEDNLGAEVDSTQFSNSGESGKMARPPSALPQANAGRASPEWKIGIVGRLVSIKNHKMFLESAKIFLDQNPDIHAKFLIIGDGELRDELESFCERNGLSDYVKFCGWRRDLPEVYADLDILCLTSLNEGTPVTVIEAMAAGVPVVAADVGGVRGLISDFGFRNSELKEGEFEICERGFLVKRGDAVGLAEGLRYLLEHPDVCKEMGQRGRQYAMKHHSKDRLVADMDWLYRNLLQ